MARARAGDPVAYLRAAMVEELSATVAAAIAEATSRTARSVVAIGEVVQRGAASNELAEMYQVIGARAKRAVVGSYDNLVTAREGPASRTHYRMGSSGRMHRYAGGALRRALNNDDMFEASSAGLKFINVTRLNREAKQWARLNAGAGDRGQGSRRSFEVTASNLVVASLGLDMDARPAFGIPPGFWLGEGGRTVKWGANGAGSDAFFPTRRTPKRPTRGIRATNFMDAGINRIARDLFSDSYGFPNMYRRVFERASNVDDRAASGATVTPQRFGRRGNVRSTVRVTNRY